MLRSTPTNLWLNRLHNAKVYMKKLHAQEVERLTVRSRIEVSENKNLKSKLCMGDFRLKKLEHILDNLGIIRSEDQCLFHQKFTNSCLPHIYKQDWNTQGVRVLKELGLPKVNYETLVITPRRWGKTWSVATYVLALLLAVPGIRICIFSTGRRASGSLLQIVIDFLMKQKGGANHVVKSSQEELWLNPNATSGKESKRRTYVNIAAGDEENDKEKEKGISKLLSYPSSTNGNTLLTRILINIYNKDKW